MVLDLRENMAVLGEGIANDVLSAVKAGVNVEPADEEAIKASSVRLAGTFIKMIGATGDDLAAYKAEAKLEESTLAAFGTKYAIKAHDAFTASAEKYLSMAAEVAFTALKAAIVAL